MLTIIPFKNVSRDKEDSYLQLLDKMSNSHITQELLLPVNLLTLFSLLIKNKFIFLYLKPMTYPS